MSNSSVQDTRVSATIFTSLQWNVRKRLEANMEAAWWLIPLSKWVITPVISGLTLLIPFITGVITHLLSGMSHQVHDTRLTKKKGVNLYKSQWGSIGDCGVCRSMVLLGGNGRTSNGKFWKICESNAISETSWTSHVDQFADTRMQCCSWQRYAAGLSLTAILLTSEPWPGNHWTKAGPYARSEICEQNPAKCHYSQ